MEGPARQPDGLAAVVSCCAAATNHLCLARKQAVMDEVCAALARELTLDQATQAAIHTYCTVLVRAGL